MTKYEALIDGGEGGAAVFEASTVAEAWQEAEQWTREGDWPAEGCVVDLRLDILNDDGERIDGEEAIAALSVEVWDVLDGSEHRSIEIKPNEEALDEHAREHLRTGHQHEWEAPYEVVGGIRENPGVWSRGGLEMVYVEACRCGAYRNTNTDPQREQIGKAVTLMEIAYPDGLYPWGEDCAYPGERVEEANNG